MNEKTSDLFSGGGRTQEKRLQEGERVDDGAEICQTDGDACGGGAAGQKPGVRVPILTREEAQNHKVMLNEKEVLHSHRLYWFGRRTQDIVFSLLALVVLSPLMLIIMAAIYIDDPHASPVFSQPRVGRAAGFSSFINSVPCAPTRRIC